MAGRVPLAFWSWRGGLSSSDKPSLPLQQTPRLDSRVLKSRVLLGKKRQQHRAPISHTLRRGASGDPQPAPIAAGEGAASAWMFRDSTGGSPGKDVAAKNPPSLASLSRGGGYGKGVQDTWPVWPPKTCLALKGWGAASTAPSQPWSSLGGGVQPGLVIILLSSPLPMVKERSPQGQGRKRSPLQQRG